MHDGREAKGASHAIFFDYWLLDALSYSADFDPVASLAYISSSILTRHEIPGKGSDGLVARADYKVSIKLVFTWLWTWLHVKHSL